jgi:pimeloyl-ACP methyl ester carboxylesterase
MHDPLPCDTSCALAALCAEKGECQGETGLVAVADAFARFEREATHGTCDTSRYRLSYYSWGSGPPLVLVPGLADCGRTFVLPVSRLAHHYRCISYDLPGRPGDGADVVRYTHTQLVEDLFALLDHLGLPRTYVYGTSFGSTITLAALHARPERFARVILQGGFARRPLSWRQLLLASVFRSCPGPVRQLPFRRLYFRRTHYTPFVGRDRSFWDHFVEHTGTPQIKQAARLALVLHRVDLRPLLAQIRQPTLVISGTADPLVLPVHADELERGLPNARRVDLVGCGHFPYFTHPEALAEIVREFLTPPRVVPQPVNAEPQASA